MQDILRAVQVLDELRDAAVILERVFLILVVAIIGELDGQALVEESQFAEAHFKRVVVERDIVENFGIRVEGDARTGALGRADVLDLGRCLAALVFLYVGPAVTLNLGFYPVAQRGHRLGADTVQPR